MHSLPSEHFSCHAERLSWCLPADPQIHRQLNLHIIIASTREGRKGPIVAKWFDKKAREHAKFDVELIDLAEIALPLLDEPKHPRFRDYKHEHTKRWSAIVDRADAFAIVTPEYDYFAPAAFVNAVQYLAREWAYKPMCFVSYGGVSGGTRSVQSVKSLVTTLSVMPIPEAVSIPFFTNSIDETTEELSPGKVQEDAAVKMLDELLRWSVALKEMRRK